MSEVKENKTSKKVFIIVIIIVIFFLGLIAFFSYYRYAEYKKEQYEIYLEKKESDQLRKLVTEQNRKENLINEATLAIDSLYEDELPKKDLSDDVLLQVENKVSLVEDEEIKTEMLESIKMVNDYVVLERKINDILVDDVLISNCTEDDIKDIEEKLTNVKEEWKSDFSTDIVLIKRQKNNIDVVKSSISSLFSDANLNTVKASVTRSQYNKVLQEVNKLPQTDLVVSYKIKLDKVLKVVEENEEQARREAEEKARREAEEKAKKEAEIKAAWVVLETPYISQNKNQIYNGCEAASLLMALQYKGYLKDKTLYQYAVDMPKSDNPHLGFVHDIFGFEPRDVSHWIAPDALAKFGVESSGNTGVVDITGSSFATLKAELKKGNPVIIYLTGGSLNEPEWVEGEEVPKNLHVMLLIGYNSKTNQIVINDPWTKTTTGKVYYSESKVVSIYNQVGKKAVVVR